MNYDAIFDAKPRCMWEDQYLLKRLGALAKPNLSVLDIASGTGRLMLPFGENYVAFDKDRDMLELNPAKFKVYGEYSELGTLINSDGFDLVTFLFGVIKDRKEFQQITNQVKRVLKPGGKFFGAILSTGRLDSFIHPELYKWGDFQTFSLIDVEDVIQDSGLLQRFDHTNGMTASIFDLAELMLSPDNLDLFTRWYMRRGVGDLGIPYLRWHYVIVEAFKP